MYHIIMAGGSGTRFWPLSTESKPKQFLNIIDDISLIRLTYNRLLKISSEEKIFIISSEKYIPQIKKNIGRIDEDNIIVEPSPKNTAPAIYLAAKHILKIDEDATIAIYPADHYIDGKNKFQESINKANRFLEDNSEAIVTMGIEASFPATSYGYMKLSNEKYNDIYNILNFIEKPNINNAKTLIKEGNNVWNAGIFLFKAKYILSQINLYIPEIKKYSSEIIKKWEYLPSISIDYAVLEKSNNCYCIKVDFIWSDVGTWQSLYNLLPKSDNNNAVKGKYRGHNSKNNLIYSPKRLTALVGLENIAVINTNEVTLVVDLSKSDDVRYIVDQINKKV